MGEQWKADVVSWVMAGMAPEAAAKKAAAEQSIDYCLALTGAQYVRSTYEGMLPTLESRLDRLRQDAADLVMLTIPVAERALREARLAAGKLDG